MAAGPQGGRALNDARQAFGTRLRTHREQLGITLPDIADTTKINAALLAALERGDLSRWPGGIYRRAFLREYVTALRLSPGPFLDEFNRLFPDANAGDPPPVESATDFRLTLAGEGRSAPKTTIRRVAVAVGELSGVLLTGAAAAWLLSVDVWSASGALALAYYPVSNLFTERRWVTRWKFNSEPRRHEEIDGHEELQVSY